MKNSLKLNPSSQPAAATSTLAQTPIVGPPATAINQHKPPSPTKSARNKRASRSRKSDKYERNQKASTNQIKQSKDLFLVDGSGGVWHSVGRWFWASRWRIRWRLCGGQLLSGGSVRLGICRLIYLYIRNPSNQVLSTLYDSTITVFGYNHFVLAYKRHTYTIDPKEYMRFISVTPIFGCLHCLQKAFRLLQIASYPLRFHLMNRRSHPDFYRFRFGLLSSVARSASSTVTVAIATGVCVSACGFCWFCRLPSGVVCLWLLPSFWYILFTHKVTVLAYQHHEGGNRFHRTFVLIQISSPKLSITLRYLISAINKAQRLWMWMRRSSTLFCWLFFSCCRSWYAQVGTFWIRFFCSTSGSPRLGACGKVSLLLSISYPDSGFLSFEWPNCVTSKGCGDLPSHHSLRLWFLTSFDGSFLYLIPSISHLHSSLFLYCGFGVVCPLLSFDFRYCSLAFGYWIALGALGGVVGGCILAWGWRPLHCYVLPAFMLYKLRPVLDFIGLACFAS